MRRGSLALLAAILAAAALAIAPAPAGAAKREVVFVANSEGGTVDVIHARRLVKLGEIDVIPDGDSPDPLGDPLHAVPYPLVRLYAGENFAQDLAISPNGRVLYVSRGHLGDVAAFRIRTGRMLWRVPVSGFRSDHLALSEDGDRLFVSAITANRVEAIDVERHEKVGFFRTGDWPHGLHLSPDGERVYNGSIGNMLLPDAIDGRYLLTIADPETLGVERRIELRQGIRPFVLGPRERRAYLQLSYLHGFVVYSLARDRLLETVRLPLSDEARRTPRSDYPLEAAHHGLALSADGRYLCAAGTLSDYAALVRRRSLRVARIIPVGEEPGSAASSLSGRYCFVGSRESDTLSVISYRKRREVERIPVGDHPHHLLPARLPRRVVRGLR